MTAAKITDGGPAFPNNGGPAFPVNTSVHDGQCGHQTGGTTWQFPGMTLRDHFAGLAMQAHLITDTVPGEACDALLEAAERAGREPLDHLAFNAYEAADAMLKARAS